MKLVPAKIVLQVVVVVAADALTDLAANSVAVAVVVDVMIAAAVVVVVVDVVTSVAVNFPFPFQTKHPVEKPGVFLCYREFFCEWYLNFLTDECRRDHRPLSIGALAGRRGVFRSILHQCGSRSSRETLGFCHLLFDHA
jgi:hypothetical protein